ncbi:hypothetical protein ACF1AB_39930 [Streptomyces sp. NPDC014846]|uniref:hypothetical protein n=1 Tax=Streptomyces sp. NPDC014846 TaxID=3364922 RepID=UPI0036F4E71B
MSTGATGSRRTPLPFPDCTVDPVAAPPGGRPPRARTSTAFSRGQGVVIGAALTGATVAGTLLYDTWRARRTAAEPNACRSLGRAR